MANEVADSWSRFKMVGGSNSGRVASRDFIKSRLSRQYSRLSVVLTVYDRGST